MRCLRRMRESIADRYRWVRDACGSHTFAEYLEDEWREAAQNL